MTQGGKVTGIASDRTYAPVKQACMALLMHHGQGQEVQAQEPEHSTSTISMLQGLITVATI